jgi:hypothetical protein
MGTAFNPRKLQKQKKWRMALAATAVAGMYSTEFSLRA